MAKSNDFSFEMMFRLILFLLIHVFSLQATTLTKIYHTAYFQPTNIANILVRLSSIPTLDACTCQCVTNNFCVTGNFFGINQTCILFSSYPSEGQLRWIDNASASMFTFPDKIAIHSPNNPPSSMEWLFDENFDTIENEYSGYLVTGSSNTSESSPSLWISPGYAGYGSAISFPADTYYVVDQMFDFTSISFSVTAWVWIPSNFSAGAYVYFMVFSHCQDTTTDYCLHLPVGNDVLRLGFFSDDLVGTSSLQISQWYHVSYIYDLSASEQMVYLNGNLDGNRKSNHLQTNSTLIKIGPISQQLSAAYQNGYIDKLIFVSRVKNASEILDEATLVAYYAFDNSFIDSGPNFINSTSQQSTTFDSNGRLNQALTINSSNTSYFQVSALYYLGLSNYSYSFSLWIYPFINNGTILQVSSSGNWCVPMIGFNKNGYLTVQTLSNNGIYSATFNSSFLLLNTWTHLAMTYSTTNGIQLFVNGTLVISNKTFNDYQSTGNRCTITIGTSLNPSLCAINGTDIALTQYHGMIDELKIFSRELNATVVIQLAT